MKMKLRGMTVKYRVQGPDELIKENSMHLYYGEYYWMGRHRPADVDLPKYSYFFQPSESVGTKVSEHPQRVYIEILSPWFYVGSTKKKY